jgi:hypothetical protein
MNEYQIGLDGVENKVKDVRVPELDRQIAKPIRPSWIQIRFQALERPECLEEDFDAFSGSTQLVVVASPVFVEP